MEPLSQKMITNKLLAAICAGIFLFVTVFSVTLGMKTDEHGNMSDCPFMSEYISVCPMGAIEHIAKWQQLFTAIFSQSDTLAFIMLLFFTFISLTIFAHISRIFFFTSALSPPIVNHESETTLFNPLVIIFSQGILHPRLYA